MARRYAVLDVFTTSALEGNPLAVVLDSDGLDGQRMQAIAREFGLPETVFVLPPTNPAHSAKVRIFTPGRELAFAGHPTVGTAVLLAAQRFGAVDRELDAVVVLEEQVGIVRCGVKLSPNATAYAEFDVPRLSEPLVEKLGSKGAIADALSLRPADIGFENHVPSVWTCGSPFVYVPVAGLEAIRRAAAVPALWDVAFGSMAKTGVGAYLYTRETLFRENTFHARMFAPASGITEDPATGAAVAAFAGLVNHFDDLPNGEHTYRIEQGFEMGRPSLIDLEVEVESGKLTASRIGGHAVRIAEGAIEV